MRAVFAALIVGASITSPTDTGLATYYNPGIFAQVVANRTAWGQLPACPDCIGYAAMLDAEEIGRRICVNGYGPLLVVDSAAAHHRQSLVDKGWIVDLDRPVWDALKFPERPVVVTVEDC